MSGSARAWIPALLQALEREPAVVRIVLAEVRGSAPREPGACMLVGRGATWGTIGGGQLEWQSVAAARALLDAAAPGARLERVVLGADAGQCCGGVVTLWFERHERSHTAMLRAAEAAAARGGAVLVSRAARGDAAHDGGRHFLIAAPGEDEVGDRLLRAPRSGTQLRRDPGGGTALFERIDDALPALWLYGAGHVGQAAARIFAELPLRLTWIDSRDALPPPSSPAVQILHTADPPASVAGAPAGAHFLVMTHSHALDYALCRAILRRSDFAWAGLIGSMSKAARFRSRLARDGLGAAAIARLVCPIGIEGIRSKWPAAIAVGVAAQLLRLWSAAEETDGFERAAPLALGRVPAEPECVPGACAACVADAVAGEPVGSA
jgi:xanthine dehydrogenase accessory factor